MLPLAVAQAACVQPGRQQDRDHSRCHGRLDDRRAQLRAAAAKVRRSMDADFKAAPSADHGVPARRREEFGAGQA
ncbi:MAG: hypothetical protein U1F67_09190 [Rubrivivax sp.]